MKLSEIQTFEEAESYLYETPKFTVKSTPEMTRTFYEYLGCPGEDKKIVHVAGTNGKGSVCTYMRNILSAHGKRCACFTSPHLVSICERFRIDNLLIGKGDFLSCFRKVAGALQAVKEQAGMEEYHPSYFEYLFFMAMVWFEEKGAEYIILETGLGGRLDATNVIRKPALCIITKIGLDHTEYLGDTLEAVAREKAGIIKENVPLVYLNFDKSVTKMLSEAAEKMGADAYPVENCQIGNLKNHEKYIDFSMVCRYYKGVCPQELQIKLPTIATYQPQNALLAVEGACVLLGEEMKCNVTENALATTVWSGRMEEVKPNLYVDGAHNEDGVEAFIATLKDNGVKGAILIFGVSADKDYRKMQKRLATELQWERIVVVPLNNPRSAEPAVLRREFESFGCVDVYEEKSVKDALWNLYSNRNPKRIYVVGSLYLVGEVKELFMEE